MTGASVPIGELHSFQRQTRILTAMSDNWFGPEPKSLLGDVNQDECCGRRWDRKSSRVKYIELKGLRKI